MAGRTCRCGPRTTKPRPPPSKTLPPDRFPPASRRAHDARAAEVRWAGARPASSVAPAIRTAPSRSGTSERRVARAAPVVHRCGARAVKTDRPHEGRRQPLVFAFAHADRLAVASRREEDLLRETEAAVEVDGHV